MAKDLVAVMEHFGHSRFKLGSHDRGARVAHRLALNHPERVEKLAVIDIVPTIEHFERANMEFAMGYYHWFWFAQPHPNSEWVISAAPDVWFHGHTSRSPKPTNVFHPDALADYLHWARQPDTVSTSRPGPWSRTSRTARSRSRPAHLDRRACRRVDQRVAGEVGQHLT